VTKHFQSFTKNLQPYKKMFLADSERSKKKGATIFGGGAFFRVK
jgi:hypothetical protein